jgi:hypothetical protein
MIIANMLIHLLGADKKMPEKICMELLHQPIQPSFTPTCDNICLKGIGVLLQLSVDNNVLHDDVITRPQLLPPNQQSETDDHYTVLAIHIVMQIMLHLQPLLAC